MATWINFNVSARTVLFGIKTKSSARFRQQCPLPPHHQPKVSTVYSYLTFYSIHDYKSTVAFPLVVCVHDYLHLPITRYVVENRTRLVGGFLLCCENIRSLLNSAQCPNADCCPLTHCRRRHFCQTTTFIVLSIVYVFSKTVICLVSVNFEKLLLLFVIITRLESPWHLVSTR